MTPARRKLLRRAVIGLCIVAASIIVLPMALWQARSVRLWLLGQVSARFEASLGLRIEATDVHLAPLSGTLELEQMAVYNTTVPERPLLTASRALAVADLWSLRTDHRLIHRLEVDDPVLDLTVPLPASEPSAATTDIVAFRIASGTLLPGEPEPSWLESWRVDGVQAEGSYRDGRFTVDLPQANLDVVLSEGGERRFTIAAAAAGDTEVLEIERLELTGPGADLQAHGRVWPATADAAGDFRLDFSPATLLGEQAEGARLQAQGRADTAQREIEADFALDDLPLLLLEPWLGRDRLRTLGLEGARADAEGEVTTTGGALRSTADIEVVAASRELATIRLRAAAPLAGDSVLPDIEGLELTIAARANDVGADLLLPLLPPSVRSRLRSSTTRIDAELDLDLHPQRVAGGRLDLHWREGALPLLDLVATTESRDEIALHGTVLAETIGAELHSRLRLPRDTGTSAVDLGKVRHLSSRIDLRTADLAADLAAIDQWVRLDLPAEWPLYGALRLDATIEGSLADPYVSGQADWSTDAATLHLAADGHPRSRVQESLAKLSIERLDLAAFDEARGGMVSGTIDVSGTLEAYRLDARLDGTSLTLVPEVPPIETAHLEATVTPALIRIDQLRLAQQGRSVELSGALPAALPITTAELEVVLRQPFDRIASAHLDIRLAEGALWIDAGRLETSAGPGTLEAELPVTSILELFAAGRDLPELPVEARGGPLRIRLGVPTVDVASVFESFDEESPVSRFIFALEATAELDPGDLQSAKVDAALFDLDAEIASVEVISAAPVELMIEDGRATLSAPRLLTDGEEFTAEATANLDLRTAGLGAMPLTERLRDLHVEARGAVPATWIEPYAGGGRVVGALGVEASLDGPLDALEGVVEVTGGDMAISYISPYAMRIEAPRGRILWHGGKIEIEDAVGTLNTGELTVNGTWTSEEGLDLQAAVDKSRFRLDYGLNAIMSGDLRLQQLPGSERSLISGEVLLEQGILRRDLDLSRELMSLFFAADVSGFDEENPFEDVELDIELTTKDGVRIRNNLARLRAYWDPIRIRGTLAEPRVIGEIVADPGGYIFAYGQTLRVDSGTLKFDGQPELVPRIELETTSSWEDPTIAREATGGRTAWWTTGETDTDITRGEAARTDFETYFANRVTQSLGGPLAGLISFRPLNLFGEEDPNARLTLTQHLARDVAVIASFDMRETEAQTYIFDVTDIPYLPGVASQAFVNDEDNEGLTLQQIRDFGGRRGDDGPRIRKIIVNGPEGLPLKTIRSRLDIRSDDVYPEGSEFDTQIDAEIQMRDLGYPDPQISVHREPAKRQTVDVLVDITPGPSAQVDFLGDRPPRTARREVRRLFRPDFYLEASLDEMQQETIEGLRGEGFIEPAVTVEQRFDKEASRHYVTITSAGGRRIDPGEPLFIGVDEEVSQQLAERFATRAQRVELAAALAGADRYLVESLAALGYPQASVVERSLTENGSKLEVRVEVGERWRAEEVEIEGIPDPEDGSWRDAQALRPGDPVTTNRLARTIIQLEEELRRRGYLAARAEVENVALAGDPSRRRVVFRVEPGPLHTIEEVEIEGLSRTREKWVRKLSRLEEEQTLTSADLGAARRRVFETEAFETVRARSERDDNGDSRIVFDIEERPRFTLGYGLRWESGEGTQAVIDFNDYNFVGRGVHLGLRGLASESDQRLRGFLGVPNIRGSRYSLSFFLEQDNEDEETDDFTSTTETLTGTLQLSRKLGKDATGRVYTRLRDESSLTITDPMSDPGGLPRRIDDDVSAPFVGVELIVDKRNDPLAAERGFFASLDISSTGDYLSSDFEYLRLFTQANYYRKVASIKGRRFVWAQSFRVGLIENRGPQVFREDRFFTGGSNSVRGYGLESLGPQEEFMSSQRPLGGEAMLVINEELRFQVVDWLGGVVFFDAGNVWSDPADFGDDLARSTGIGLRFFTPAGLFRLDWAIPLDGRDFDPSSKLYVGFGHAF